MNVAGRFMPQLVCGFPALVIQKPFYLPNAVPKDIPPDKAIDRIMNSNNPAEELGAPPQFLGMVEGVSHAVSQDGGSSTLSLSHCRSHLGIDDEFVGTVLARVRTQQSVKNVVRYTLRYDDEKVQKREKVKASYSGVLLKTCQLWSGAIGGAGRDVHRSGVHARSSRTAGRRRLRRRRPTSVYARRPPRKGGNARLQRQTRSTLLVRPSTFRHRAAPSLTGRPGREGGIVKLIEVLPPYEWWSRSGGPRRRASRYFRRRHRLRGAVGTCRYELSRAGVEYVVQPSWMSTSYDNENIGPKVYKPFFGCDSIVDTITLGDFDGEPGKREGHVRLPAGG